MKERGACAYVRVRPFRTIPVEPDALKVQRKKTSDRSVDSPYGQRDRGIMSG